MSLEVARDLSIPDLLRLVNEKLILEYNRIRETAPPCSLRRIYAIRGVLIHIQGIRRGLTPWTL